jgi:hypothetical protein
MALNLIQDSSIFVFGNEIILGRPCIQIINEIDYIYVLNTWILILK